MKSSQAEMGRKGTGLISFKLWAVLILLLSFFYPAIHAEEYRSPITLVGSHDGQILYVAEHTANSIAMISTSTHEILRRIALSQPPEGLVLSPDGMTLYVTGAEPDGLLMAVDVNSGELRAQLKIGHTPCAVGVSPDGTKIFVVNRFDNAVAVVDTATLELIKTIPVLREPIALAFGDEGQLLYVANHLPVGASDGDYIAAVVSVIDINILDVVGQVALPNGSTGVRGLCASPKGDVVYVTHILARYHLPTTQLERGWMNTNALSIIDAKEKRLINTVLLDDVDQGAANPWAPACTPDGRILAVSHAGTHEISVIDRNVLHEKLTQLDEKAAKQVPNHLAFLVGLRTRVKVPGNGPRGLWLDNTTAHLAMYYSDSIASIQLESQGRRALEITLLGGNSEITQRRQGEIFFNDAALCFQQWQSCASCHPDGRVDGLNWDLLNDGIGNPKNTKSMVVSHVTPPVMSLGVRSNAEMAVRAGIKFIQFAVRPEEDAVAIDEYLKSLKPVPSPLLENGQLSASAMRGKEVFERAACSQCHLGPYFADQHLHELGLAKGLDTGKPVDTPTLIEVWRTAPYLHDGRAATMRDVLTVHNPEDRHGKTAELTEQELEDLIAYVLSL